MMGNRGICMWLSDLNNLLMAVSLKGQILKAWALPGESQEGITVDDEGRLYIAAGSWRGYSVEWQGVS